VRPARAAALARPPPPRAPHVQSCVLTRRLRRELYGTQVSGDVSVWAAMTMATYMCVLPALLRSLTRRPAYTSRAELRPRPSPVQKPGRYPRWRLRHFEAEVEGV
jgi:hypothetical protein